jgi:DNA polymerase I-like protein with 3'-5' exonuclease and polymerase domains
MRQLVFDIETDGFVDKMTRIHCIAAVDPATDHTWVFGPDQIPDALDLLSKAGLLIGHNAQKFDIPAIQKLYRFQPPLVRDTLILARLYYPDIKAEDFRKRMETKLVGSHSLAAWGKRLGIHKGDYAGPWEQWSQEMQDYCEQDVQVTLSLYRHVSRNNWGERCIDLEHRLAAIIDKQEANGFKFDERAATALYAELAGKRAALETELVNTFGGWWDFEFVTPKVSNSTRGIEKGIHYAKVKRVTFNPSSRQHVIQVLMQRYGWEPIIRTDKGQPVVDETILQALPYPEAKKLSEYYLLEKRIAALAEGKTAWLKLVKQGRIHGRVITNGTPTGRATHSSPNMSQVPSVSKPYGKECRALFCVPAGKKLVGVDVSGLELRMLAHYLQPYDQGAFCDLVTKGDIHTENWKAAPDLIKSRQQAKPVIYAMIYGASDGKLGELVGGAASIGKKLRGLLYARYQGLDRITKMAADAASTKKYLVGLDGRRMPVRSAHSALNTLLQGAGGVLCKQWIVAAHAAFEAEGLQVKQVAWSHDEIQLEVSADIAERVGQVAVAAIQTAAAALNVRCPLTGEYKIGNNWADTH